MKVKCAECGAFVPHEVVLATPLDGDELYFCSAACLNEAERAGRLTALAEVPLPEPPRRIVVASDGSGPSRRAVEQAAALGRALGAEVQILHAIGGRLRAIGLGPTDADLTKALQDQATRHLAREQRICERAGVPCSTRVALESPLEAILEAAQHADLLVMGSRGAGASVGNVLGGLSSRVVGAVDKPVLVVH